MTKYCIRHDGQTYHATDRSDAVYTIWRFGNPRYRPFSFDGNRNSFFNQLAMSPGDTRRVPYPESEVMFDTRLVPRESYVEDDQGRRVDPRAWLPDIERFNERQMALQAKYRWRRSVGPFVFRKGPVEGIHKPRAGSYYRDLKMGFSRIRRRSAQIEDMKIWYREEGISYRVPPSEFFEWENDRVWRNGSWKDNSKARKSWGKHKRGSRKHVDPSLLDVDTIPKLV